MITVILITLTLCTVHAAQMPSREASLSSAMAEMNKGRILESIGQFKEILRSDPASAPAYFYLSTLYTELKEYDVAERYLQRAMEVSPKQGAHYYQMGVIRFRQKQWRPALGFYKQALEFGAGSNEATVWRSIGDVQVELFDRAAALQAYQTALRIQPRDATTQLAIGRFYSERSESEQALSHLKAAVEIDPNLRGALPVLARAYRQAGDAQSALSTLRRALDADPADQESRYTLGQILLAFGRVDEGRSELDRYEKVQQQVTAANRNYEAALSQIDARQFSEAEKTLREAVRLAPNYGPALHSLGALLLDRGSPDKAVEFLKRASEANPLNAASWHKLGSAYLTIGKLPDALEAVKRAIVLKDEDAEYQRLLIEIQQRMRR